MDAATAARPSGFVILGYSSGAHLGTLIATHQDFLQKYQMSAKDLVGVIALDIPYFDIPYAMQILEIEDTGLTDQTLR
jgi:hypothetical protein